MLITEHNLRYTDKHEHQNSCVNNNNSIPTDVSPIHQRRSVRHRAAREFLVQSVRGLALTVVQSAVGLVSI
jgi:hypothetical protein